MLTKQAVNVSILFVTTGNLLWSILDFSEKYVMVVRMNFNDSASFSIKANDYRIHFWDLSLDEAVVLLKNTILTKKRKI